MTTTEDLPKHHQMMVEDGAPEICLRIPGDRPPAKVEEKPAVQTAKSRRASGSAGTKPAVEKERVVSKKSDKAKAKTKVQPKGEKAKSTKKAEPAVRAGSKVHLVAGLLTRKEGCTNEEVLKATGWPSVSMPQQAKAAGLSLRKEKEKGKPTRYFGKAA
jgi:hypothetical protein